MGNWVDKDLKINNLEGCEKRISKSIQYLKIQSQKRFCISKNKYSKLETSSDTHPSYMKPDGVLKNFN